MLAAFRGARLEVVVSDGGGAPRERSDVAFQGELLEIWLLVRRPEGSPDDRETFRRKWEGHCSHMLVDVQLVLPEPRQVVMQRSSSLSELGGGSGSGAGAGLVGPGAGGLAAADAPLAWPAGARPDGHEEAAAPGRPDVDVAYALETVVSVREELLGAALELQVTVAAHALAGGAVQDELLAQGVGDDHSQVLRSLYTISRQSPGQVERRCVGRPLRVLQPLAVETERRMLGDTCVVCIHIANTYDEPVTLQDLECHLGRPSASAAAAAEHLDPATSDHSVLTEALGVRAFLRQISLPTELQPGEVQNCLLYIERTADASGAGHKDKEQPEQGERQSLLTLAWRTRCMHKGAVVSHHAFAWEQCAPSSAGLSLCMTGESPVRAFAVFTVQLSVSNTGPERRDLAILFPAALDSMLIRMEDSVHLGAVEPQTTVCTSLHFLPLRAGRITVDGLRLRDVRTGKTFVPDQHYEVFVV